nr:hypothetical protein [uncultured Chryseobacterium sp.]
MLTKYNLHDEKIIITISIRNCCIIAAKITSAKISEFKTVELIRLKKTGILVISTQNLPPQWIEVEAPCDKVYWMQAGNYTTVADFLDAQQDFNDAKFD